MLGQVGKLLTILRAVSRAYKVAVPKIDLSGAIAGRLSTIAFVIVLDAKPCIPRA